MADVKARLKYLRERLESLSRQKNVFWGHDEKVKIPKPAEVIKAESEIKRLNKIVARFDRKVSAATKRRAQLKKKHYEACRKEVFFGDPMKALKMLDQFEAKW